MAFLDKVDPEIRGYFEELLADLYSLRYKGEKIEFRLKPGECTYRYYQGPSGRQYCYTPHPSTKGDYFVFTYVPKGKGSRSGKASRFALRDLVRCAKRKTARGKALQRYEKDKKEAIEK
jgi:hypothetical protein